MNNEKKSLLRVNSEMVTLKSNPCFFCESTIGPKNKHHVIPRKLNKYIKGDSEEIIYLCPSCHAKLHELMRPLERTIQEILSREAALRAELLKPWLSQIDFETAYEKFGKQNMMLGGKR